MSLGRIAWKGGSWESAMCFISATRSEGGAASRFLWVVPMTDSGKSGMHARVGEVQTRRAAQQSAMCISDFSFADLIHMGGEVLCVGEANPADGAALVGG